MGQGAPGLVAALMNEYNKTRAAVLIARYGATPGQVANKLGLAISTVVSWFDNPTFQDLAKVEQDRLVKHAIEQAQNLDLPYQETLRRFREGSRPQKLALARSICLRLPPYQRWPD